MNKRTRTYRQPRSLRAKLLIALMVLGSVAIVAVIAGTAIGWDKIFYKLHSATTHVTFDSSSGEPQFPDINMSQLSPVRQKVIRLARQEFMANPPGTKYSQGANEPWCADFISWLFKEAGSPLKNPHTGSWRIPGTFTLREYYQQVGKFKPADSGYTPRPGDVAIYHGSPIFGDHTHMVLKYDNGILTTVGGNEGKIRVFANTKKQYDGLVGYGVVD